MNRLLLFSAIILLVNTFARAQEQLGMRTSNYAGVNGLTLNPANNLTNPFSWDINLIEFGQFFDNNYLFIENFSLLDALHLPEKGSLRPDLIKKDLPTPPNHLVVDFYRANGGTFHGAFATNVMGPSVSLRLGESSSVGFYTRARVAFHANKVPGSLGYYEYQDKPFDEAIFVDPFKLSAMVWSEIGLNYAHQSETDYGKMSIGGTLKFLQGYEAAYAGLDQAMTFRQVRGNKLIGEPGSASYAFASSAVEDTSWQLQQHGAGLAVDLGFVYTIAEEEDAYRWKFGVSLLDIGSIRFNKAAEKHQVVIGDSTALNLNEFKQFEGEVNIDSIVQTFSEQLLKDPNASLQSRAFGMWLPAALSLQGEVAITPSFFVNATVVQALPFSRNMVRRSTVAALTPRFERRWFEAALPITMIDWKHLRSGLAVRLAFFWLGTEDLGSIFKKSDFDSTDFYVAIKVNPFQFNKNKKDTNQRSGGYQGRKQSKIRARGNGGVKCPKF